MSSRTNIASLPSSVSDRCPTPLQRAASVFASGHSILGFSVRLAIVAFLLTATVTLPGCNKNSANATPSAPTQEIISTTYHVGQAVVGSGKEVAHIDIIIGHKDGPVGTAFVNALANQKEGHSNLLAVIGSNVAVKPSTVLIPKVATQDSQHSVMLFGPAQSAVAKAVSDCLEKGIIPAGKADDWVVVCGVYLHWDARDSKKVYKYNYLATKDAIEKALSGRPGTEEINKFKANLDHPWMPTDPGEETSVTASRTR